MRKHVGMCWHPKSHVTSDHTLLATFATLSHDGNDVTGLWDGAVLAGGGQTAPVVIGSKCWNASECLWDDAFLSKHVVCWDGGWVFKPLRVTILNWEKMTSATQAAQRRWKVTRWATQTSLPPVCSFRLFLYSKITSLIHNFLTWLSAPPHTFSRTLLPRACPDLGALSSVHTFTTTKLPLLGP